MNRYSFVFFFVLYYLAAPTLLTAALKVKISAGTRGRPPSRGRKDPGNIVNIKRSVTVHKRVGQPLGQRMYDDLRVSDIHGGVDSDSLSPGDITVGQLIKDQGFITGAPVKTRTQPIDGRLQGEEARGKTQTIQKVVMDPGKISQKVRSISPRKISVVELDMGPQEMAKTLTAEARKMEEEKEGINKGSAELACGRYSFLFHCEIIEIKNEVLEKRRDKYLYTVKDIDNKNYAWNTAQGTYGRVVFGYIQVPSAGEKFHTITSAFSTFYKLPEVLTGVKVLFHGGGKYPPKYLLPGMKVSVAIKSYFRGIYKIARLVWNREREILYSLSKEFWTDGAGDPVTHTPTVFSVHYQNQATNKQEVLFQDQENRKALVSELLIMERITGQTFFEVLIYLQDAKLFSWLEKTNAWELWFKAIYKLQWNLNHVLQSFMASGYVLYMHCDLNRSNILLSIPELTFDHKTNLMNIYMMNTWDIRLIDLSFVWVPSALRSRNMNSICSQVNKGAIFSDANYLYVCIIELLKVPQKDLPISNPSPLYKAVRERALKFWDLLDSINEWWAVGVNFVGRNSSTHTRYKIRRPDLGGNTYNESIEGLMLMSDVYDSQSRRFGVKLPYNSFSPESYARGYLHLSFRLAKLGLCIRTKMRENWSSLRSSVSPMSYFDFSVLTLYMDRALKGSPESCELLLPGRGGSHYYTKISVSKDICQSIKACMSKIESMRSIPGDEVIKPAISVVTAENHESDRFIQELREVYNLPESLQIMGARLLGRFQGLSINVDIRKETIINLLKQFHSKSKQSGVSFPSESHLRSLCDGLESSGGIRNVIGTGNYELLLKYASNYRLSRFCQVLFKVLPNTKLFSDIIETNSSGSTQVVEKEESVGQRLPSRRGRDVIERREGYRKEGSGYYDDRRIGFEEAVLGYLRDQREEQRVREIGDHDIYMVEERGAEKGLLMCRRSRLIKSGLERDEELRSDFLRKNIDVINKVGGRVTKYKSIMLLCSVLDRLFSCRVNIKERSDVGEERVSPEIDSSQNTGMVVSSRLRRGLFYEMQWRVLSGKYGSVTIADVRIPDASSELFIKSHVLSSYSGMTIKTKGVRAWFHGSSLISPGWITSNINLYLAIKSPFTGVHSHGDELWERENKMNLLLSRELFCSGRRESGIGDGGHTGGATRPRRYQISPGVVTFHSNCKGGRGGGSLGVESNVPKYFYLSKELRRQVRVNQENRPIFSNYMFMEYIDGFSLDIVLYYLRSDDMYRWLDLRSERWGLWLSAVLNLVLLVVNAIQSFSSSGYFLYMHCDLNFGNILISKEGVDWGGGGSDRRLLQDKKDHETNLGILAGLSHRSVRIIDYSFSYILNNRRSEIEQKELDEFIKENGIEKVVGERNFEGTCKQNLKSALFNDPNYAAIVVLEILKGYSVLYNKSGLEHDGLEGSMFEEREKWNNIGGKNRHMNVIDKILFKLENTQEWSSVSMKFVRKEEPTKRWISNNGKHSLSTFNQGVEVYMRLCDTITSHMNSVSSEGEHGIISHLDVHSQLLHKGGSQHGSLPNSSTPISSCFSIESYIRGYLFLPFSLSRIGSCILDHIQAISGLRRLLDENDSHSYFQLSSLTVDFVAWMYKTRIRDNDEGRGEGETVPTFEFYHELRSYCGPGKSEQGHSFLDDSLFLGVHSVDEPKSSLRNNGVDVSGGIHNNHDHFVTSMASLKNIDLRFDDTLNIYKQTNENQLQFLLRNVVERKIPPPFSLLIQRTWYRLQELPELLEANRMRNSSQRLFSFIMEIFDVIIHSFRKNDAHLSSKHPELLLISDKLLLNHCIYISNNGDLNFISNSNDNPFINTFLSNPAEFCKFTIKPIYNKLIL